MDDETPITVLEPQEIETAYLPDSGADSEAEISSRPATLHERFAAFFADSIFFFYLLAGWTLLLKKLTHANLLSPLSFQGSEWILFASTGAALYFLYYLFFEGVLTATPGKLLGGLSVERTRGGPPSLIAIFLRNLFRIIDTPLFFITAIGLIEATDSHQRLGDLVARTVVVREERDKKTGRNLAKAGRGGATERSLAFLIDLALILPFFYGLLLMISTDRALVSMILLNLVPVITLFMISLSEFLFQTTFGKALFGLKVIQEDGQRPSFSLVLVRNGFRLVDTNPIGYLCAALSTERQRPGDIAAGTLVIKDRQGLRGWFAIPFMSVLAGTALYLGTLNPQSFLKKGLRIQISHYRFNPVPMPLQRLTFRHLHLESVEFGFNEEDINVKGIYDAGDVIYLLVRISGYTVKEGHAWIQGDIKVRDQNRAIVLERINIVNASLEVGDRKSVRLATRFALNPAAASGPYEVTFQLRDLLGNSKLEEKRIFTVRP